MRPLNECGGKLWRAVACGLVLIISAPAQQSQQPAPQATQSPPQVQPAADPTLEPLRPEELLVPSNAALESATPAVAVDRPTPSTANPPPQDLKKGSSGVFVMRTEVDEVVLHATVVDERLQMVTSLDRSAFSVLDNDQPQAITSFRHEDVAVAVGIVIDDSGSMRTKRAAVNQAALNFVRASNPDDQVFIVNFNDPDSIFIDTDFTSSIPKLKQALENIDSRGGTALYDAVVASADHVAAQTGLAKQLEKKVLLVITDGVDHDSTLSLEQTIRSVQAENGPAIYTIGILDDEDRKEKRVGKRALTALSQATGGIAYFPRNLSEVDSITQEVARDIRNQYIIGIKKRPDSLSGFHTLKVTAKAPGFRNLQVRTRSGYYAGEQKTAKTQ